MYLQPNTSNNDVVRIIKERITTNTPFSLTRFGDGEIYILNNNGYDSFNVRACSVVTMDIPDNCVVVGVPGKIIKTTKK